MNDELKSCPFCGNDPEMKRYRVGQDKYQYAVLCRTCGATFCTFDYYHKAVEAWNKRTSDKTNFLGYVEGEEDWE